MKIQLHFQIFVYVVSRTKPKIKSCERRMTDVYLGILTSFFFITKSICMYFINIVIVIPSYEVLLLLWGFNSYTSRINHKYASLKIVPNDLVSPLSLWHEKNGNEWCGTCWNSSKIFTHLFQKGHCSCWDTKQAKYLKCPTAVFLFFFSWKHVYPCFKFITLEIKTYRAN